ncbi:ATP-binding protein [Psychrobacter glaciei]|uniref:ATP-binding protein n=1 Tax=Psychrobacter glaciei TaxID=619771 RepID=UPI003F44EDB1
MELANILQRLMVHHLVADCSIHGETDHWRVGDNEPTCKQCEAEARAQKTRENKQQLGEVYKRIMSENGVSPKAKDFTDWQFDNDQLDRQKNIISVLENLAEKIALSGKQSTNGKLPNILLIGGTGSGKTMLATALVKAVYRKAVLLDMKNEVDAYKANNHCAKLIKSRDITEMAKATWGNYNESEYELIEYFSRFPLLVIDDLGDSDAASGVDANAKDRGRIADIFDKRYQKLPTVITTNLDKDGVANHLGDRAWDRLQENLIIIRCDWGSYRQSVAKVLDI